MVILYIVTSQQWGDFDYFHQELCMLYEDSQNTKCCKLLRPQDPTSLDCYTMVTSVTSLDCNKIGILVFLNFN